MHHHNFFKFHTGLALCPLRAGTTYLWVWYSPYCTLAFHRAIQPLTIFPFPILFQWKSNFICIPTIKFICFIHTTECHTNFRYQPRINCNFLCKKIKYIYMFIYSITCIMYGVLHNFTSYVQYNIFLTIVLQRMHNITTECHTNSSCILLYTI